MTLKGKNTKINFRGRKKVVRPWPDRPDRRLRHCKHKCAKNSGERPPPPALVSRLAFAASRCPCGQVRSPVLLRAFAAYTVLPWASAHRGKWGQLTPPPLKNG